MPTRFATRLSALVAAVLLTVAAASCSGPIEERPSLILQAEQQESTPAATVAGLSQQPADGQVRPPAGGYAKRMGLHIDVPYLANRKLDTIPAHVIADQLGAEVSRKELPESELELSFEKAEVWLYDDRIYRIRKKLAHPMDIPTALGTSGFPLDLGAPIEASAELRWNFTWNMRRIRLERAPNDDRLYVAIDVYAFLPKEFF